MSGANSTPLGRPNLSAGAGKRSAGSLLNPSYFGSTSSPAPVPSSKREIEVSASDAAAERRRKRKSRWQGDEKEKTFIPGMPTVLPSNMNNDQEKAYLLQLQVEELSRRLRSNDLGIPPNPEDRSPSPEPIYNNEGKRLNTREYRTRKKLEDDRHNCITNMMNLNPDYKPPADYKPPLVKVSDKVMIPQEEHPDINFVGLLIGPRGNTLKSMEKDTGAKIIIRGKGSVKEGKVGRKDGGPMPGEDEPLHAYVTASNPESVKKAVDRIKEIIRQGVEVPEGQNDLRRMQLRELALLNGTLRENDNPRCTNCGSTAHKSWQCPDKPNVTSSIICSGCGGVGHIMMDCKFRNRAGGPPDAGQDVDRQKIDEEYMSLMAELGEGPAPTPSDKRSGGGGGGQLRSLFDSQVNAPKAIEAPMGGNRSAPQQNDNWNNGNNYNGRQNRYGQSNNQGSYGRPPPNGGGWGMQNNGHGNFQGVPPPILSGLPPPPPPGSGNSGQQNPPSWVNQTPPGPPPPNMNQWQGPPGTNHGMGCPPPPPPGPVPPPRPVGPPPGWGWNGPQNVGMPPPGPPGAGVDLGSLLSAPPPPPPS